MAITKPENNKFEGLSIVEILLKLFNCEQGDAGLNDVFRESLRMSKKMIKLIRIKSFSH